MYCTSSSVLLKPPWPKCFPRSFRFRKITKEPRHILFSSGGHSQVGRIFTSWRIVKKNKIAPKHLVHTLASFSSFLNAVTTSALFSCITLKLISSGASSKSHQWKNTISASTLNSLQHSNSGNFYSVDICTIGSPSLPSSSLAE